jgi:hypothetical protein
MSTTFRPIELAGTMALSGREQLLQMPFKAGVAHVDGKYGFTQSNYLIEGANRIMNPGPAIAGPDAIFIYLQWKFLDDYPQKANGPFWPPATPASLTELAQTAPYQALFNMPFNLFVITTFGFQNQDRIDTFRTDPNAAINEEQEFYDLTRYLYSTYAGTGKTFILKNWEGDYAALPDGTLGQGEAVIEATDITPQRLDAMTLWMKARQRGVSRARTDSGSPAGVGVFHAVEMSRVLDYTRLNRVRLVNQVIPAVGSDMVSYSSYDSSIIMNVPDAASTRAAMNEALNAIKSLAPDPLGLGDKRIFISEYGLFENGHSLADTTWRTQTILETSQAAGILGSFMWEVFDNECYKDYPPNQTQPFPVDCSPGDAERPSNTQCRGLWIVKPDESPGAALTFVGPWFRPSTSGVTLSGRVTSTSGGGVANALIAFYGGLATADANGNYSLTNVPPSAPATVQFTASASGFQTASQSAVINPSNNPTINFALRPSTDAGSISGKVTSAVDGTALSGVSISYDGQSTTSDASGNFHFDTVPGGSHAFSTQRTGWIPETVTANIQPGISSVLNLRLATGGQLNGQVNNNTGAGVAGASVNAHGGLVPTNVTVLTNSSGAFSFGWLPVGDYYLVVTADGYVQDDPTHATATLTVGATTSKTLTLSPKSDFSLTVTPSSKTITGGNPATFTVQLNPLSGFNSPVTLSVTGLPANATASFNPATISSGTSTLTVTTALTTPAGNYTLTISGAATGLQHSTQATLTVNAAPGTATGKVTNAASGVPISGATVFNNGFTTTTDANGNYTLSNLPAGSLPLSATASGFLTTVQTVNITPGGTTTANFVLITQTGTVSGRVTNASTGAGLAGVKVSYSGGSVNTNSNGDYTLNAVLPGTYTITATLTGWVTESTSVQVFSGATATANIKLATGGKAAGKVTNKSGAAISGATVKVTGGIVPTNVTVTTSSSGTYDSGWVPIGNYTITVSKQGFTQQTKNTTVTTGGTVTVNFTLQ